MRIADTAGGVRRNLARHPSISALIPSSSFEVIFLTVAALLAAGIVMLFSLDIRSPQLSLTSKFFRHILFLSVALSASYAFYRIGATRLLNSSRPLFILCAAMLLLVFVPPLGGRIRGAARWLSFGIFHFQPSELAKLVSALVIANFASEMKDSVSFKKFLKKVFLPVGLLVLLVLIEPDFGSAVFIASASAVLLFVVGTRIRHILLSVLLVLAFMVPVALVKLDHVRERIEEFLSESGDARGVGYQPRQSLIALGSGGLFGCGLGASRQKLMFLPDRDTDFVFAILGEESGFCGTMSILLLFALYFFFGVRVARRTKDVRLRVLFFAAAFIPTAQALLNIAVVTASIPTKGIALPFVAFGGSSLLINMLWVALLLHGVANSSERSNPCEN